MARVRRTAQKKPEAPEGNDKNTQFAQARFQIMKNDIELYKAQQAEIKEEDLKLLKFIDLESNKNDEEEEDVDDATQRKDHLIKRVNQIKQQIDLINKVATHVEKDLHLNEEENKKRGLNEEQIKEVQLKQIQEEQQKYKNLVFNMDYQLDQKNTNSRGSRYNDDYSPQKWFELQPQDQRNQIRVYSYSGTQFYSWVQNFSGKNEYQHFHLSIQRLETEADYFKFDDFVQTIKLTNNSFQTLSIDVSFDNNLCLLALLRVLLSINRYNILSITPTYTRNKLNLSNCSEILESIFEVIFSHRNLQGLKLQPPVDAFNYLVNSFSRVKASLSQLRVYSINTDLKTVDTNKVTDYFKFLSTLPRLYHIAQMAIPVSAKDTLENLNVLLKRLNSAYLNLSSIPASFNFEFYFINLRYVKLEFGLEPNILTHKKLDNLLLSLKEAKSLAHLRLTFYTHVPQETSRKEILKQAQTIKNLKNKKDEEEIPETKGETPQENVTGLKFFDNLSELTSLEDFHVTLKGTQEIYDSLHKLLIRSTSLKSFSLTYQYEKEKHLMDKYLDLKNIYETLNTLKKCRKVNIQYPHGNIRYELPNKDSTLYIFRSNFTDDIDHPQYTFKPYQFQFDNIKTARIQCGTSTELRVIDTVCKSLSTSKKLKNIHLTWNFGSLLSSQLKNTPFNKTNLPFFKHLEALNELEHFYLSTIFDQEILNTLSSFTEKSKKLKSFIFKRVASYPQYYLDYTQLFKALSTLPQLQQFYLNVQLESQTITENHKQVWESHKDTTFHQPFCDFIKNSSETLQILDLDENNFNESFVKKILQALFDAKHHHYMKFNTSLSNLITQSENEDVIELLKVCDEKGVLVKPYFKFPLCQPTGSYYDYNYDY